jgi:choline dehydrogenase/4-pyridoxate dehydrogenase
LSDLHGEALFPSELLCGGSLGREYLPDPFLMEMIHTRRHDVFAIRACVLRLENGGHVRLAFNRSVSSADHRANFLATDKERKIIRAGIRIVRDVGRPGPLVRFIAKESGPVGYSDSEIDEHIDATGISVPHPLGTCKMGPSSDTFAVVDEEFRVLGIDRLRIFDASVMPDLIGGNINAPIIMVA